MSDTPPTDDILVAQKRIADLELQIDRIREEFRERVRQAVDAECSCGGSAKGTLGCPACGVYHRLIP